MLVPLPRLVTVSICPAGYYTAGSGCAAGVAVKADCVHSWATHAASRRLISFLTFQISMFFSASLG